ncbi:MAG: thioredoxin family protein [Planctomycetes bacterium]|nr:thioredoxin family protein [Planctomycetota bacterium]
MKKSILLVAVTALLAGGVLAQETDKPTWFADFDLAQAAAKKAGKGMLVDFTGSDWCIWCKRLDKEVFEHASFLEGVAKDYVLVKLDFPNDEKIKAKVPNPARNDELMNKYGVGGFPTILLMDGDGEVFARTGYQEGGPEAYLKHVAEISADGKKQLAAAKALQKEFESAEGDAVITVITKALVMLEEANPETVGLATIAKIVRGALSHDADDAKGMKTRAYKALIKTGQAEKAEIDAVRAFDPKNEKGLLEYCVLADMNSLQSEEDVKAILPKLEEIIELGVKDAEHKVMIYANTAFFHHRFTQNDEKAKKYALMLKALPDLEPRAKHLVEMILGREEGGEDEESGN